jgi:hypothetical protein
MRHIARLQEIFDRFCVRPTYVVDYPVAAQREGWEPLRQFADSGRASIGAHLHPWVTPPFEEELSAHNSYQGNLNKELEFAKVETLTARIQQSFGIRPSVFKAGRYGLGPNTFAILSQLGYEVDLSPLPPVDFSDDTGPDFSSMNCAPFRDSDTGLLVLPNSGAFCGWWPRDRAGTYRWVTTSWRCRLHLNACLSRSRALLRVWLNPECFPTGKLMALTRFLLKRGLRCFVLSMHSSSLVPGGTPFVPCDRDVTDLLNRLTGYLKFFFEDLGGEPWTPQAELNQCSIHAGSG